MSTATRQKLITAEEFMKMPDPEDGSREELVKGAIVTMPPPSFRHGEAQANVCLLLKLFARKHRCGRVVVESGVVTTRDPDSVRGPDVSYYSFAKVPEDADFDGYAAAAPDLCVEVLSPDDRKKKLRGKIEEYFAKGVRMVWVIDPKKHTATIHRGVDESEVLEESDTVTAGDVLPGFTCKVAEFFAV